MTNRHIVYRAAVGMGISRGIPTSMGVYEYGDCDKSSWSVCILYVHTSYSVTITVMHTLHEDIHMQTVGLYAYITNSKIMRLTKRHMRMEYFRVLYR